MANETSKFVSLNNLKQYDENAVVRMENADAEVLKQAKEHAESYANGLAENYDPAGSAKTVQDNLDAEVTRATAAEEANKELAEKAQADVDAVKADYLKASDKTELQGNIDALDAKVGEVAEGKTVVGMIAENTEAIEAHKTDIDAKVTTLVGEDVNKSVRTIANEELAAQLLSGEADADFQTLQELAAWLEDHPEDVATINLNIVNLQKLIGTLPEGATATDIVGYIVEAVAVEKVRAEEAESDLDERLQAVESAVGDGGAVGEQIDAKIAELDADITSATVDEGKGVQVQVVEIDGKVTTVAVTGNYDNSYDTKGAAEQAKTDAIADAEAKDTALEIAIKEYVDAEDAKVETRVEALETVSATHALKTEVEAVAGNVDTLEADMEQAKTDIATKATTADLEAEVTRAQQKEAELEAAIGAFVEADETDIENLFK